MKTDEAKQQFIKAWQAQRNLSLLGMLTDSQHNAIHTKILNLRNQYDFEVTTDELDSDLHQQTPALTEEQMEQEAEAYADSIDRRGCTYWMGMYRGYLAALRNHAYQHVNPAPVVDGVLDAIADDILHMPVEDAVYAGEIVKILKKHLTPQP